MRAGTGSKIPARGTHARAVGGKSLHLSRMQRIIGVMARRLGGEVLLSPEELAAIDRVVLGEPGHGFLVIEARGKRVALAVVDPDGRERNVTGTQCASSIELLGEQIQCHQEPHDDARHVAFLSGRTRGGRIPLVERRVIVTWVG